MEQANLFLRIGPVGYGQVLCSRVWLGLVRSGMVIFMNSLFLWSGNVGYGGVVYGPVWSGGVRYCRVRSGMAIFMNKLSFLMGYKQSE